jgi:hypothetical protein
MSRSTLRIGSFRSGIQVAGDVDLSEANILHFAGSSMIAAVNHPKAIVAALTMLPVRVDEARPAKAEHSCYRSFHRLPARLAADWRGNP